jgi:5S rRNA maturation endonuclease (ribonuclease M5)
MELIDKINSVIHYQIFYGDYFKGKQTKVSPTEVSTMCPFHTDKTPSFTYNLTTGQWHCFSNCGSGNIFTFIQKAENLSKDEAQQFIINKLGLQPKKKTKKTIDISEVESYHEALLNNSKAVEYLQAKRGINIDTIEKFRLGYHYNRYTIPIFDEFGHCINIRKYSPTTTKGDKFKSYGAGYGEAKLFPYENVNLPSLVLCEGEMDCMLLNQLGIPAITVTSGAGIWKSFWTKLFEQKTVYICFDIDEKGKSGSLKIADYLKDVCKNLYVMELPITEPDNGDVTDYFITHGKTSVEFKTLIQNTKPYLAEVDEDVINNYIETPLAEASEAKNYFKHFEMKVLVAGKDLSPYLVPQKICFTCDQDFDKKCHYCPVGLANGRKNISFDLNTTQILEMIQVTKKELDLYIRKTAGIVSTCSRYNSEVLVAKNVEEIRLIPDIDYQNDEQKYVVRQAFFIGHGIESNKVYVFKGITIPDPKTQYATHMIHEARKAQDSIDTFKMNPKLKKALKVFQIKGE